MISYAIFIGSMVISCISAFIIGGGVTDLAKLGSSLAFKVLAVFLIGFTFFGFFHTLRWIYAFECHRSRVNGLAEVLLSVSEIRVPFDPTMRIPPMRVMPESIKGKKVPDRLCKVVNEIFRTRFWFPLLYFGVLIGITLFSFFVIPALTWIKWTSLAASTSALLLGIRWYFSLKEVK